MRVEIRKFITVPTSVTPIAIGCSVAIHLENLARAFLPERVHLLARKSNQQTVLGLMLRDVFYDVRDGLRHRDALNGGLPSQLLSDGSLLL